MNSFGCKKEINDRRDYKAKIVSSIQYPKIFTLSMPQVKNQGIVSSCVAHSLATFLEKYFSYDFSVGFIYGYRPTGYSQEEGMYPREALKTLQKIGDVKKNIFDYNKEVPMITKMVEERISELKEQAKDFKIQSYARIYTVEEIKKCLFSGTPVPASIPVYNDLEMDDCFILKQKENPTGYHMIIICGWNEKGFIFQNSWGQYWGDNGKAIIPYDYPIDSAWAISMENNDIETYQTLWQKIYKMILKLINSFRKDK